MKLYKRNCPICNKEIIYKSKKGFVYAQKNNSKCASCHFKKINSKRKDLILKEQENNNIFDKKINKYFRYCLSCNKIIYYSKKGAFVSANNKQSKCLKCAKYKKNNEYKRNCPICNKEIIYKSNQGFNKAKRKNSNCINCANKLNQTKESKIKRRISSSGKNNPMYGKSVYQVWIKKYGQEIADKKLEELKNKQSKNSTGKNNPMYGKPSPQGSGNGWSGYYKGYYFRSLLELFYLKYLIDNNIKFENGEKKKYVIEYKFIGKDKTYRPDYYLINNQEIIEIKPKKLINSHNNKAKFEAAKLIFKNKFRVLTEDDITIIPLKELYNNYFNKILIFDKKYEEKFLNYYNERKDKL